VASPAHVAETREVVTIYYKLAERTLVAGLFHSTCYICQRRLAIQA